MTEEQAGRRHHLVRSYVVRGGRLSKAQSRALEALRDTYCIPFQDRFLDLNGLFDTTVGGGRKPQVVIEIGFGMGDVTASIAHSNREKLYIGIEVFLAGVGKLLSEIQKCELGNVRINYHDTV